MFAKYSMCILNQVSYVEQYANAKHKDMHALYQSCCLLLEVCSIAFREGSTFYSIIRFWYFSGNSHSGNGTKLKGLRQLQFTHGGCQTCKQISLINEYHNRILKMTMEKCTCSEDDCCCKTLYLKSMCPDSCTFLQASTTTKFDDDDDEFFIRYDQQLKGIRYFCAVCHRYGKAPRRHFNDGGDWVLKGVSFENKPG